MLAKVRRTMHEQSGNFNRDKIQESTKQMTELKNITEKYSRGVSSRLNDTEESIIKDRTVELIQSEQGNKE